MPGSIKSMKDDCKYADVEHAERISVHDEDRALEEKALIRKIDLFLLPTIWLMYVQRTIIMHLRNHWLTTL